MVRGAEQGIELCDLMDEPFHRVIPGFFLSSNDHYDGKE